MNAFTDTVDRDLGLDNVSIYQVESNLLHFCCFAENLKFHYVWVLGDGSLAWLQVSDKWCAHTSSRYFCDTVSHSLACEPKRSYDSVSLFFFFLQELAQFQNEIWKLEIISLFDVVNHLEGFFHWQLQNKSKKALISIIKTKKKMLWILTAAFVILATRESLCVHADLGIFILWSFIPGKPQTHCLLC